MGRITREKVGGYEVLQVFFKGNGQQELHHAIPSQQQTKSPFNQPKMTLQLDMIDLISLFVVSLLKANNV